MTLELEWMNLGESFFLRRRIRLHQCSSEVRSGMAHSVLDKGRWIDDSVGSSKGLLAWTK